MRDNNNFKEFKEPEAPKKDQNKIPVTPSKDESKQTPVTPIKLNQTTVTPSKEVTWAEWGDWVTSGFGLFGTPQKETTTPTRPKLQIGKPQDKSSYNNYLIFGEADLPLEECFERLKDLIPEKSLKKLDSLNSEERTQKLQKYVYAATMKKLESMDPEIKSKRMAEYWEWQQKQEEQRKKEKHEEQINKERQDEIRKKEKLKQGISKVDPKTVRLVQSVISGNETVTTDDSATTAEKYRDYLLRPENAELMKLSDEKERQKRGQQYEQEQREREERRQQHRESLEESHKAIQAQREALTKKIARKEELLKQSPSVRKLDGSEIEELTKIFEGKKLKNSVIKFLNGGYANVSDIGADYETLCKFLSQKDYQCYFSGTSSEIINKLEIQGEFKSMALGYGIQTKESHYDEEQRKYFKTVDEYNENDRRWSKKKIIDKGSLPERIEVLNNRLALHDLSIPTVLLTTWMDEHQKTLEQKQTTSTKTDVTPTVEPLEFSTKVRF